MIEILGELQNSNDFEFTYIDNRPDPIMDPDDLPDEIKVTSSKGEKILREYQMRGVRGAVNNMTGILFNSTGSGKTVTALATIQELLPYTEPDERIAFFTDSSAIFNQVYNEFSDTLKVPVGKWGNGKKDIQKVTIAMVPTVASALKTDPEKGLSLTPKQRLSKKIAKEILPMFTNALNAKLLLTTYVGEYKPKTKADNELLEELKAILDKSESSAKVKFHLNAHNKKYQDILKKKAKKEYEKRKDAEDFMSSLIMFVADECLVGDTMVSMPDGTYKAIQDLKVGDSVVGGEVEETKVRKSNTYKIRHEQGILEGSLTHPTYLVRADRYQSSDLTVNLLPFMAIKEGDYLLVPSGRVNHDIMFEGSYYELSRVLKAEETNSYDEVYDIKTTSGTFIANGTLTHNCHHTKSDSFYYTFLKANNAMYRLGLTGSIDKEDGFLVQRLQGIFGDVISRVTNEEMIGYGISATPTIFFSPVNQVVIEGEQVNIAHERNYMQAYDKAIVKNEYRNLIIAKITEMSYNKGRGTLIILNRIEHGDNISRLLDELKVPYEFVQGEVEIEQREKHFENMRNGQLKVLIATSIMDEGVDISGIDSLIMGAGGKSLRQVLQRVGRGLRHKDYGGNKLYVYDFTDQTNKYVAGHYEKRKEIYQSEGFEIKEL